MRNSLTFLFLLISFNSSLLAQVDKPEIISKEDVKKMFQVFLAHAEPEFKKIAKNQLDPEIRDTTIGIANQQAHFHLYTSRAEIIEAQVIDFALKKKNGSKLVTRLEVFNYIKSHFIDTYPYLDYKYYKEVKAELKL